MENSGRMRSMGSEKKLQMMDSNMKDFSSRDLERAMGGLPILIKLVSMKESGDKAFTTE